MNTLYQQQQIKESLMMSNSYRFAPVSSNPNAFNPIQQQIDIGNSSASMNIQGFGGAFDPIHILSSWKISQRQQAATRLAADSVAAKSGAGSFGDFNKLGSSSFPPMNNYNMPYFGNNITVDFSSSGQIASRSVDCLFSATNTSNTDTSVEDDGISVIFSDDSRSLWNINDENAADSSGESTIDAFHSKTIDVNDINNIQFTVNEQTSSFHPNNNPIRSSESKRYMGKRSHDQALFQSDSSMKDSGFQLNSENDQHKSKKTRSVYKFPESSSNINFQKTTSSSGYSVDHSEEIAQMKEMIYRAAAFRPVTSVTEVILAEKPPKIRKNVRISTDPQTAAARRRRERISERIRELQKLVPGGSKMDTASMLDEAANYLKFLRSQVKALEDFGYKIDPVIINSSSNNLISSLSSMPLFNYPLIPMQPHFPPLNLNSIKHPIPKC